MQPRKSMTLVFLILLLGIGYVSMDTAPVLSDEEYSYHGDTAWQTNFSDARQAAAEQDKPVIIYFWTTWCTYCEDYNQKVYPDPEVQSHLDNFVKVAVNLDSSSPESSQLKREYNADYPPMHVIITPDGEELVKISGYADKDSFIQYLETAKQRANSGETQ